MTSTWPQMTRDAWEQQLRSDPDVAGSTLLVALLLATYGDRDGTNVRPTVARVASDAGVSEPTVKRAVAALVALGYLERLARGCRVGDGTVRPSSFRLSLRIIRDPESARSTDHARSEQAVSTDQIAGLYGSNGPSLGITRDPLPVKTRNTRRTPAAWRPPACGQCDERRQITTEGPDGKPLVRRCPRCHPLRSSA